MDSPVPKSSDESDSSSSGEAGPKSAEFSAEELKHKKLDNRLPKIPGSIEIDEREDSEVEKFKSVNIVKLHAYILSLFKKTKKKRLEEVDFKLESLKKSSTETILEKEKKKKNIKKWKQIRRIVYGDEDMKIFDFQGNILLVQYLKLAKQEEDIKNNPDLYIFKNRVISEYIEFAQKIIQIDQQSTADLTVPEIISSGSNSKSGTKEDDKTEREIFNKAFLSHQAKRPVNIPEEVYKRLDEYFSSFEHLEPLTRGNILKIKLLASGKRKGTSKELMRDALSATGNASYYDRENLICVNYWKWKLADLSSVEAQVMIDFDETQKAYHWMKKTKHPLLNRDSNLNIGYRLYQHLRARGIKCKKADFKIIGGRDILIDYDKIWQVMVEKANIELKKLGHEPMIFLPTI